MDLQTLEKGNELLAKYRLCEKMLEYLSDPEAVTGQVYKEKCGEFFKVFHDEMLVVTHTIMTKCGEQFTELHCEEHTEGEEPMLPPTEPKEPKFPIGSLVEIVGGEFDGCVGIVKDFDEKEGSYYVKSGFVGSGNQFAMWFGENALTLYEEESEEPTPEFKEGDIVAILTGEARGELAKIVYYDAEDKQYRVEFLSENTAGSLWCNALELAPYAEPENPEENGGTDTPDEGEQ